MVEMYTIEVLVIKHNMHIHVGRLTTFFYYQGEFYNLLILCQNAIYII